jgi:long-chain acyl-CoA synthetase
LCRQNKLIIKEEIEKKSFLNSEIVKAILQLDPNYEYDGNEEALKEDITAFAKEHCAPYEVLKILEITEELPLTVVGKIDKKVLRKG